MRNLTLLKLLFISLLVLFVSCNKNKKDLTTVDFHIFNPITNEAYAGVDVKIIELKSQGSFADYSEESKVIWEGVTDSDGKASHSFKAKKGAGTSYWQYIDENLLYNPSYHVESQPHVIDLEKKQKNLATYKIVKKIYIVYWYQNVNCIDQMDKCRIRTKEYRAWANGWGNWGNWFPMSGSGYYEGCYSNISQQPMFDKQTIKVFDYEITRNGVTTNVIDTIYITGQDYIDTVKIFY